ncbi:hypothetical protein L4C36_02065 [Photobacterium japonica]|uniref:hypothetical protein n=1 Tax=Photobacterium japonica TaxID=2910235 RepID=UPI003D10419A
MNVGLPFLIPALLGAQLVLTMVLTKGEICPGQRGRVHKTLPILLVGWLIATIFQPLAVLPLLALAYFTMKVKTGKTRDAGPLNVFYAADGLAAVVWLMTAASLSLPVAVLSLMAIPLFGALLAHLLLTQARTRLQAFHRLLPFAGVASAILSVLCLLWVAMQLGDAQAQAMVGTMIAALVCLVAALLVWAMHLLSAKTVNRWQLLAAAVLLVGSAYFESVLIMAV